jgi:glutamate-ammonia-ligase adenylyltransferase
MNTAVSFDFDTILQHARHCSRFVRYLLDNDAELPLWLKAHYGTPLTRAEMEEWLNAMPGETEETLSASLRKLRKLALLKLVTRDLSGLSNLAEVVTSITALAELATQCAQAVAMREMTAQYGTPIGENGKPQELLVIGMGKLGGGELNASSDIDLIFVYPEDGETDGTRKISNYEFFLKLGRKLIGLINEHTGDGFVFRVDMRLRPYGESGPLVTSFAALEEYLATQGREWERYAWIKARVISPADSAYTPELMRLSTPFVFRKYLDFNAIASMRALHAQIRQEVARRDRMNNVKLGPGGIREIEFIAQVFQLIRGGRSPQLRIRPTLQALAALASAGQIDPGVATKLSEAYIFLRNLEHRLQYLDDQQTQDIPENDADRTLLACGMNYPDYAALLSALDEHRAYVSLQFNQIFSTGKEDETRHELWQDGVTEEELSNGLRMLGYKDAPGLAARLIRIKNGIKYRQLQDSTRQRFDNLVSQFIPLCAAKANCDAAFTRLLSLLESIGRRASYLAFLSEYPIARERLASIADASAWASEYLNQYPILLDELLDTREIYSPPDWPTLDRALQQQVDACADDFELQMDALRQFLHSETFKLLAMDLQGLLPLEILSDHLSDLADLILQHVLRLCWRDTRKKHREEPQFAIIAYGKLGGRELGYASDLDLIFLYQDEHPDAGEIYARLAQRINTVLGSYTSSGRLYETDLRLRPNGASGLLVSSIAAFEEYQLKHAWVWEHQALTRARFCAGDERVGERFQTIRHQVLRQPRDAGELRREIVNMREKMHDGHPNPTNLFDIKHDNGGMVDIEFIVQYLVLAHAYAHPELTDERSNLRLLKLCGELGLITHEQAESISALYRQLRALQHRMRLNSPSPCRVSLHEVDTAPVTMLWNDLFVNVPRTS